jgi:ATP-dependent DNA helicase RecG
LKTEGFVITNNNSIAMTKLELIQQLTELRSMPAETEVVEFKEARNDYDFHKLGKYFSALCNEANLKDKQAAWIIFGVENIQHHIVGSNYRHSNRGALDNLKSEIANKTTNRITFIEIHELVLPEGRVVMFQVPPAPRGLPIAWEGHYYGRDGEELSPLNLEEIERIRKQATHIDWSAGICPLATIDDLSSEAIMKARSIFKNKNQRLEKEIDQWSDEVFLNKAKITINGKISRAAIILLGKPESEHFLSPGIAHITWVLKDKDNIEKDYQHFSCPLILAVDKVLSIIRNLKYRYLKDDTLFPEEVDQYDPFNIKEALSNCIAHQDYTMRGRITVVEREDGVLFFSNVGEFLPGSIENLIQSDEPPAYYRNDFLAKAMVSLNMIDTIGSGIKRMYRLQSERFFPLPDYDFSEGKVKASLTGKMLDQDFARALIRNPDLTLSEIFMLDKVQKKKELTDEEIMQLKSKKLIEGRKPNFIIAEQVAIKSDQFSSYLKNRGFNQEYYKKLILEFIQRRKEGSTKHEIRELIWEKLPNVLTNPQKENKISNILREMRLENLIVNLGSDTKSCWKSNV